MHNAQCTIVTLEKNSGKGAALKAGFRKALDMGFSYAITLDGDGQHYPKEISRFLEANREHPWTLIVGSRNQEGINRSKGSNFANRFSNFWFWVQTGRRLSDTQTGYRLYPLKRLHGLSLLTSRYEAELELLVFASWHGTEIVEIPIDVYLLAFDSIFVPSMYSTSKLTNPRSARSSTTWVNTALISFFTRLRKRLMVM